MSVLAGRSLLGLTHFMLVIIIIIIVIIIISLAKQSLLMACTFQAFVRLSASSSPSSHYLPPSLLPMSGVYLCSANGQRGRSANLPRRIIYCYLLAL